MIKLSLGQLASVEKRLQYLIEVTNDNCTQRLKGDIGSTLSGQVHKLFYVDQLPDFTAIASVASDDMRQEESPLSFLKPVVNCYGSSGENVVRLLLKIEDIQWDQPVYIFAPAVYTEDIEGIAVQKQVRGAARQPIRSVMEARIEDIPRFDVPEGFYISSLNESDVDKVDDSWPYSDKNSKMFISWLIRNYTTTAIRTADSYLVAHAIC